MVKVIRVTTAILCAIVLLLLISSHQPQVVSSQDDSTADCELLVEEALQIMGSACAEVGRNEACYGHTMVNVTFHEDAANTQFSVSGDISPVIDIDTLITEPIDLEAGTWGVAMMRLQADLPEADEESAMTLVLFGNTQVFSDVDPTLEALPQCTVENQTGRNLNIFAGSQRSRDTVGVLPSEAQTVANGRNADGDWVRLFRNGVLGWIPVSELSTDCDIETLTIVDEGDADDTTSLYTQPMQAFSLQTGDNLTCEDAPDGLLVESPSGQRAHVMVNGVELEFASTGFLSADRNGNLLVSGLDGEITVRALLETVQVLPGFETRIRLRDGLPIDIPEIPFEIENLSLGNLPEGVLERNLGSILDDRSFEGIDRARRSLRDLKDLDVDEFIPEDLPTGIPDFPR